MEIKEKYLVDTNIWLERLLDQDKSKIVSNSLKEKSVLVYIENNPGCKSGEIANKLGIPVPTVKKLLPGLLSKSLIEKHGTGPGTNYSLK